MTLSHVAMRQGRQALQTYKTQLLEADPMFYPHCYQTFFNSAHGQPGDLMSCLYNSATQSILTISENP